MLGELIEKFGFPISLVIFFLWTGKSLAKWVSPFIKKMFDRATTVRTVPQVAAPLTTVNKLQSTIIQETEIARVLRSMLRTLNANRSFVYEFHNGGKTIGGIPFYKFSCTYEEVNANTKRFASTLQNILISLVPKFINRLLTHNKLFVANIETHRVEIQEDKSKNKILFKRWYGAVYSILQEMDVKSVYVLPIKDLDDNTIGFAGIHYTKDFHNLTDKQVDILEKSIAEITAHIKMIKNTNLK